MPLRVGTVGFIIDPSTITGCGGEKENLFVLCIGRRGVGKGGKIVAEGNAHVQGVPLVPRSVDQIASMEEFWAWRT